MILYNTTT